jgi:hypothetical protein
MRSVLIIAIAYFVYMLSMITAGIAAMSSGSWQRISDGRILIFRTPWTHRVFVAMLVLFFLAAPCLLLFIAPNSPGLPLGIIVLVMCWTGGLLMLLVLSPRELQIDLQEKTYHCMTLWLPIRREAQTCSLTDFSGVCALSGGTLLLVFRKKRGVLYGWTLGRFKNKSQALEQAEMFSLKSGLPVVNVPW